jgi:hypothetical protein
MTRPFEAETRQLPLCVQSRHADAATVGTQIDPPTQLKKKPGHNISPLRPYQSVSPSEIQVVHLVAGACDLRAAWSIYKY